MAKKPKPSQQKKGTAKTKPSVPKKTAQTGFWDNRLFQNFLIGVLAFSIYANTIGHDFTQDDAIVITENMYTTQGVAGISGLLKYDTFKGFFKVEGKDKLVSGGRYRPLTPILFALQWDLFKKEKKDENGMVQKDVNGQSIVEADPMFFHIINILFYVLCCLLVFWSLLEFLKGRDERFRVAVAFGSALLFTVHPLHTEAVANIKGADEIFTLLLSLVAFILTLRSVRNSSFKQAVLAGVSIFFALLAKENAITFLAIIPFGIYFSKDIDLRKNLPYLAPIFVGAILFLVCRFAILGASLGDPPRELLNNPYLKVENGRYVDFTAGEKTATITYTLGKYVQLFLFPKTLTHDYYPRAVEIMTWKDPKVLFSFLLYLLIIFFAVRGLLKKDLAAFGLLFFLAALSIVSNIVFPVGTNMSERFLFMPSVGLCFALCVYGYRLLDGKNNAGNLLIGAIALPLLLLAYKTVDRNGAWKDNFTLFTTDIEYSPRSAKLQNSVGAELSQKSQFEKDPAKQKAMLNKAIGHLQKALEIHPNSKNTYLQLGNSYTFLKEPQKAIGYYDQVLTFDPNDLDGIHNKSIALREAKQFDEAISLTNRLRNTRYTQAELNIKLAYIYEEAGKHFSTAGNQDLAIQYFDEGLKITTDKDKLTYFKGVAYALKKDYPNAIRILEQAVQMTAKEENRVNIYRTLSGIYQEAGNTQKAQEYAQRLQQANGG